MTDLILNSLPSTGYLRLWQIIGDSKRVPPIPPIIPVRKTKWWSGVKSGEFPRAYKLSARCTGWKVEDIRALVQRIASGGAQ